MSYLKYFLENCTDRNEICNRKSPKINEEHDVDEIRIQGLCFDMCPKEEVEMRTVNNLVHVLEIVGEQKKLIKSFTRSAAADFKLCEPSCLRPFPVLVKTMEYLMFDVVNQRDISHRVLYNFVEDRLRSIRQDMVVQRLPRDECRILLEPMIRFYVYSDYRLAGKKEVHSDLMLNKKYLLECLNLFLKLGVNKPQGQMQELFTSLHVSDRKLPYNYVLMESLYMLCNVGQVQPLYRYLSLPNQYKCEPNMKLAYQINISYYLGNFVHMFRLIKRLSPLGYFAIYEKLAQLQREALVVLSHAYNSKQLCVPCFVVQQYLYLRDVREVERVCSHYGITVTNGMINFNKAHSFSRNELHTPLKRVDETYQFDWVLSATGILGTSTT